MQTAQSTVSIDNEQVRVTTWSFEPGERTGRHTHELPYVVVPLTDGALVLDTADGSSTSTLSQGGCYFRDAGAEHDVSNGGDGPLVFVEVELKG